ncbi:MAG: DNRLRE domain-containing protein [Luteitalea sp.]|nr:DNRLRE domain-containing protein [Luteitalea sp.]
MTRSVYQRPRIIAVLVLLTVASVAGEMTPQPPDTIPAFPEARGCGAEALDISRTKPLRVHFVTNTNSGGFGSLRAALEVVHRDFFDIIIFRTGGRIDLTSQIRIPGDASNENWPWDNPEFAHLYVAGQTAPGGGITITQRRFLIDADSSDLVFRYLTFRKNDKNAVAGNRAILDHISASWTGSSGIGGTNIMGMGTLGAFGALDGNETTADDTVAYYTMSNTLLAEPEIHHPTVMNPSGKCGTFYGNFWQGPGHRYPWHQTTPMDGGFEFVNNVVYNWSGGPGQARSSSTFHETNADFVANYHLPGPATNLNVESNLYPFYRQETCLNPGGCDPSNVQIYLEGNRNHRNNFVAATNPEDAWAGPNRELACGGGSPHMTPPCSPIGSKVPSAYRRSGPLSLGGEWAYDRLPITDALRDEILATAGNSRGLNCNGTWFDRRDALDSVYVDQFYTETGGTAPIEFRPEETPQGQIDADEAPVVPTPAAGTPCADTDEDGIPNAWEILQCGTATCVQADAVSASGYLMIEHYLNGSNPNDPTPWDPASAVTPVADAYVQGGSDADTNFGTANSLRVKTASAAFTRRTHLKFDLSGVAAVGAATLRLFARVAETEVIDTSVFGVANTSWSETGITWNNKPALGGTPLDTISVEGPFQWYDLDVTSYIQDELAAGRTTISLGLRNPSTSNQIILAHSRENANSPELVLTGTTLGTD